MSRPGRKPARRTVFTLPCPPPNEGSLFAEWQAQATAALKANSITLRGCVRMELFAAIPTRTRNLPDATNAVIRLLVENRVIEATGSVTDAAARWDRAQTAGTIRVVIRETVEPAHRIGKETRARISATTRARKATNPETAAHV